MINEGRVANDGDGNHVERGRTVLSTDLGVGLSYLSPTSPRLELRSAT